MGGLRTRLKAPDAVPFLLYMVEIIGFDERYASDFGRLNYQWIAESYTIEPHDREILDDPAGAIIGAGGEIFFALVGDEAAGTVALIPMGENDLELTKMAVSPEFRGQGIGDRLMEACIEHGRKAGRRALVLESNTKQEAAIGLYRKFGFVEIALDPNSEYVRANIRMEMVLSRLGDPGSGRQGKAGTTNRHERTQK